MKYGDLAMWDNAASVGELVEVEGVPCALVDLGARDARGQRTSQLIATLDEHVEDVRRALGEGMPPVVGVASREALDIVALLPLPLAMFVGRFREVAGEPLLRLADPSPALQHGRMEPEDIRACYARPALDEVVGRLADIRRRYRSVDRMLHRLHRVHTGREDIDVIIRGFFDTAGGFLRLADEHQQTMQDALVQVAVHVMGRSRCVPQLHMDMVAWLQQQAADHAARVHLWRGVLTPAEGRPVAPGDGTLAGWDNTEEAGRAAMRMACLMLNYPQVSFGRNAYEVAIAGGMAGHVRQAFALLGHVWDVLAEGGYPDMLRSLAARAPDGAVPPAQLLSPADRMRLAARLREIPPAMPGLMPVAIGSDPGEVAMVRTRRRRPLPGDRWLAGATRWLLGTD